MPGAPSSSARPPPPTRAGTSPAARPMAAGRIAELSGLSTGAVTGVIDRLERAGYVRRVRDPHDRRKVLVEVSRGSLARYGNAYDGLTSALDSALVGYTDETLDALRG